MFTNFTLGKKRSRIRRLTLEMMSPAQEAKMKLGLARIEKRLKKLRGEINSLREDLKKEKLGRGAFWTVYEVQEHWVRRHKRKGYRAVRLRL